MKTPPIHSIKRSFVGVLPGFFFVMMLVIAQACSDPVSTNEAALDTEAASQTAPAAGAQAGQTGAKTPPDGNHPDPNRPGNVIICHIPSDDPDNPVSLSILPSDIAAHSTHENDYDGPCAEDDTQQDDGTDDQGDQGADDQDDPNAQPINSDDDDGGDDDGTLDGDYPDPNRPGNVIICHVPPDDPDHPVSLSILPSDVGAHGTHADDYDGLCKNDAAEGDGTGDQGDDDQDDANAAPVGGGDDDGGDDDGTSNDGRGSSGL